jgi:hypothetical protein
MEYQMNYSLEDAKMGVFPGISCKRQRVDNVPIDLTTGDFRTTLPEGSVYGGDSDREDDNCSVTDEGPGITFVGVGVVQTETDEPNPPQIDPVDQKKADQHDRRMNSISMTPGQVEWKMKNDYGSRFAYACHPSLQPVLELDRAKMIEQCFICRIPGEHEVKPDVAQMDQLENFIYTSDLRANQNKFVTEIHRQFETIRNIANQRILLHGRNNLTEIPEWPISSIMHHVYVHDGTDMGLILNSKMKLALSLEWLGTYGLFRRDRSSVDGANVLIPDKAGKDMYMKLLAQYQKLKQQIEQERAKLNSSAGTPSVRTSGRSPFTRSRNQSDAGGRHW